MRECNMDKMSVLHFLMLSPIKICAAISKEKLDGSLKVERSIEKSMMNIRLKLCVSLPFSHAKCFF